MRDLFLALALVTSPTVLWAQSSVEAGETAFKRCQSCHVVRDPEGEVLAGKRARTGPNLYGVIGRTMGSEPDFRYSRSLASAAEANLVWDQDTFVAFVQNPTEALKSFLDDNRARSKMSLKLKSEEMALDLFAFLSQFGPDEGATEEAATAN